MNGKVVYFAGKVSMDGGYRGKLLGNTRVMSCGYSLQKVDGGNLIYGGPFALSCDHGCFHSQGKHGLTGSLGCGGEAEDLPECLESSGGHGVGCISGLGQPEAVLRCISQIRDCHAVHAYLDTISCYGTLVELGYAAALAKPIYIYYDEKAQNWDKHFWFCMNLPGLKHCGPGTEMSIHPDLLTKEKTYNERYHEYLQSDQWKALRKKKLKEAGKRCQLCNKAGFRLNVHHRTYDRVFNELLSDLIVLCEDCHKKFHDIAPAV